MERVKLFLSQKYQFELVEKIKDINKKRTRASLFQSAKDGKQDKKVMWPNMKMKEWFSTPERYTYNEDIFEGPQFSL